MNKNIFAILLALLIGAHSGYSQIDLKKIKIPGGGTLPTNTATALSESDIINGLKEALTKGATKASDSLNKTDGFNSNSKIRIPFPEDCRKVASRLRELGYGKKVDDFELRLNRAAEQAAKEAKPIFVNSIKQMGFADAKSILKGPDTAATSYLKKTTYDSLYRRFNPHIKTALDQTAATKLWKELTTMYNKLPTTKTKVQSDLVAYTTHKSLKGLFTLVADEELKIRKDPLARTSDILKKVFGQQN